ncbi:hypothetical protein WAE61_01540 [Comamonadaceae bacterium PP-2]
MTTSRNAPLSCRPAKTGGVNDARRLAGHRSESGTENASSRAHRRLHADIVLRWCAAIVLALVLSALPALTTYAQLIAVPAEAMKSQDPLFPVVPPGPDPLERQPRRNAIRIAPAEDPPWQKDIERLSTFAAGGQILKEPPGSRHMSFPAQRAEAAWLMGLLRLHGLPNGDDAGDARQWFERAQASGSRIAEAGLAWCAIDGCGQPPSRTEAEKWLTRLDASSPAFAQYLRWLTITRANATSEVGSVAGTSTPDSIDQEARAHLLRAARQGDVNALIALGIKEAEAGQFTEARMRFRQAAARSAAAAHNVRIMNERLGDVPASASAGGPGRAGSTAPRAAPLNDVFAQAQRFHRGQGTPVNFSEAIRLYRLAAQEGHPEAQRMLALIFSRITPNGQLDVNWMQQLAYVDTTLPQSSFGSPVVTPQLQQEPTPLFHLLPADWRDAVLQFRQPMVR